MTRWAPRVWRLGALAGRASARGTPQGAKIKLRALHDALDTALRTLRIVGARSARAPLRPAGDAQADAIQWRALIARELAS